VSYLHIGMKFDGGGGVKMNGGRGNVGQICRKIESVCRSGVIYTPGLTSPGHANRFESNK